MSPLDIPGEIDTLWIMKLAAYLMAAAMMLSAHAMAAAPEKLPAPEKPAAEAAQKDTDLLAPGAAVKKIATGMKFIEGPVWMDADGGYLLFSDIPSNQIKRWDAAGGLSTFRTDSHESNGNTRDGQGRLITCEHAARRVTRTQTDGTVTVLADSYRGRKLNSPNDVVVKSDGSIWFTDPTYGIPKGQTPELDKRYVFRLDPRTRAIEAVAEDFEQPNGLCFSPDEAKLYIADSGRAHHIRVFDVKAGAALAGGAVFCVIDRGVPDGIRCDERGNVWSSAGDGVQVFAPDGRLLARIAVPESPANLCFGGPAGKRLFMTARTSLYSIDTNVRSAARPRG
jgi:gluconolactonase